jgi:hypothetical protein
MSLQLNVCGTAMDVSGSMKKPFRPAPLTSGVGVEVGTKKLAVSAWRERLEIWPAAVCVDALISVR